MPDSKELLKISAAVLVPNIGGIINGMITRKQISGWYETLQFPSYRPPNWIFGPMWTSLYTATGYASYMVYRDGGGFSGDAKLPLMLYGAQFALNMAWSPIFFGQHNIKGGLIDILALTATASACGVAFYKVNKSAALIFVPYLAWLGFATLLNWSMWKLNCVNDKKE